MKLIAVRHAMPAVDPATPPQSWPLSGDGLSSAALLPVPAAAYLVASTEPKAYQTLEPFGPVTHDARFGEIRRQGEPFDGNFRELRLAYVTGTDHPLWEPRSEAVARFDAALAEHAALAGDRTLVVGTHGMVLTVWLTARIGVAAPGEFWAALRFPGALAVDLVAKTMAPLEPQVNGVVAKKRSKDVPARFPSDYF